MDDQPSVDGRPRIAVPVMDCVPSMPSVKCSTSTICASRPGGRMAACPSARHLGHAHIPEIHGFTPARPRAFYETRCVCTRHTARAVNTGGSAARPSRRRESPGSVGFAAPARAGCALDVPHGADRAQQEKLRREERRGRFGCQAGSFLLHESTRRGGRSGQRNAFFRFPRMGDGASPPSLETRPGSCTALLKSQHDAPRPLYAAR